MKIRFVMLAAACLGTPALAQVAPDVMAHLDTQLALMNQQTPIEINRCKS